MHVEALVSQLDERLETQVSRHGVLCRAGQLGVDFSVEAMQEQLSLLRALRAEELSNENNVAVTASSMTTGVKVRCVRVTLPKKCFAVCAAAGRASGSLGSLRFLRVLWRDMWLLAFALLKVSSAAPSAP